MTKREVVWLIIRLAGLYFLWHAGEATVGFMTSLGIATGELCACEQTSCKSGMVGRRPRL